MSPCQAYGREAWEGGRRGDTQKNGEEKAIILLKSTADRRILMDKVG